MKWHMKESQVRPALSLSETNIFSTTLCIGDGTKPLIIYFEKMAKEYPNKSIEFVRSIAEGDLVALHTHQKWPGGDEYVTMDFFRFDENGKIVEHWDAMQNIPEKSENNNTMY